MTEALEGRAWVFPDANINTDVIMPRAGFASSGEEQLAMILSPIRPGWAAQVEKGDFLITGRNFGTGSSRPAAHHLRELGIAGIVCESMNDLFLRNCVNSAMPALDCRGILEHVREGDRMRMDLSTGEITNLSTGATIVGTPMPRMLMEIIEAGGVFAQLKAAGYM